MLVRGGGCWNGFLHRDTICVSNCSLEELNCLKKIFGWNGNYCSFHLLLFSRGSVGIIAPRGGINILVIDRGILLVVVFWKYYLTYKNICYSRECFSYLCGNMCSILADMGIGIIFGQDTFSILWFYGNMYYLYGTPTEIW